ncbi:Na+/H+ antiporter subunit E [Thiomonas sp.]|uniref:Na+/H+ antiporter subunit E n=1 Tax=Thiomonas sp. TaxID=2047785 RepID=UPI00261C21A8|nr:Na+/H+ antiporter subunit E [Thiomonas sp.]
MRRRLFPHPVLSGVLLVLWLLLVNGVSPGQVAAGVVLGWAIPLLTQAFWPEAVRLRRPLTLLRLLLRVLGDIVRASVQVAVLILGPQRRLRPAFIALPLQVRSDLAISLLANIISLTPGTVSAWLTPDRRTLWVHALHAPDPQALLAQIRQRYEAPLQEVFES